MKALVLIAFFIAPVAGLRAEPAGSLSGSDSAILIAVLSHFEKAKESNEFNPPGAIGVAAQTVALNPVLIGSEEMKGPPNLQPPVPPSALSDYLKRNSVSYRVSLPSPAGDAFPVETPSRELCRVDPSRSPGVRTCAFFRVPGYSSDGAWAFVTFNFMWAIHSATGVYLLKQESGQWVVVATKFRHYV